MAHQQQQQQPGADVDDQAGMPREELLQQLRSIHQQQASTPATTTGWGASGDRDSWKDLYRILLTSLRASSAHFSAWSLETLTIGLWALSTAHAGLADDIAGRSLGPADRQVVADWLHYAEWARAFDRGSTAQQLEAVPQFLGSRIVCCQPESQPLLPAHLLALDHSRRQLLLVVRGTSSWADAFSDLVAHTSALGPGATGQAHSGMLESADKIIQQRMALIEQQLQQHPGYRVHCIGHSLGGGVAALVAYQLRNTPVLRARLSNASGVVAWGFGTPPVMTLELAQAAGSFTRTLVHQHDVVPRACVASMAALRAELDSHTEAALANNKTAAWLRESGVLAGGKKVASSVAKYAAANTTSTAVAAAVTRNPGMQRFVAAGLQVGASLLADKLQRLHTEAMAGGTDAVAPAAAAAAPAAAAQLPGSAAVAPGSKPAAGAFSFAALRQAAVDAAAGLKQRQAGQADPDSSRAAGSGQSGSGQSIAAVAAAAAVSSASASEQPAADAAGAGAAAAAKYEEEEQAASVMLYSPGQLLYLKRTGLDKTARYELLQADPGSEQRFGKIVINRCMLRDHYLDHYVAALKHLQQQIDEAESQQQDSLI